MAWCNGCDGGFVGIRICNCNITGSEVVKVPESSSTSMGPVNRGYAESCIVDTLGR